MEILVLLSGGLDSTTVAGLAVQELGSEHVGAISFQYGQKHGVELQAARDVALQLRLKEHWVQDITGVFAQAHSALVGQMTPMPEQTYEALRAMQGPSPTYVPLRNSVLMTIAGAYALIHGYDELWVGVHADDALNDAYPDCRMDAVGAIAAGMHIGSYYQLRVRAPLQYMTKADVVRTGMRVQAPLEHTWSCYEGVETPCGRCPTCVAREQAFREVGVLDASRWTKRSV